MLIFQSDQAHAVVQASPRPGPVKPGTEGAKPLHWSATKQFWDRKTNKVSLVGNAIVHQPGEVLTADYIDLDMNSRTIDARSNCIYLTSGSIIYGREMHFNMNDRTGTVVGGRITSDTFSLAGERIVKLTDTRFRTSQAEYSTCKDCEQSWAFQGEDVDLEMGGYAYMDNVRAKIKDVPFMWFPYLIIPVKTERQTGLLFPRFHYSSVYGFNYVQPFFWAINRSSDMTISPGMDASRGRRLEWEGRYILMDRSEGQANFFYQRDKTFEVAPERWGLNIKQRQNLGLGIEQKLKIVEFHDNFYPKDFPGDVPVAKEGQVASDLILSHSTSQVSSYVAARRFRNLLYATGPDPLQPKTTGYDPIPVGFDPYTVQVLPTAEMTTNDKFLLKGVPVASGITLGVTNFARPAGFYDRDIFSPAPLDQGFRPGTDPIREATRFSLVPSLYTTIRPWDVVSVVPSLQYRAFMYNFPKASQVQSLSRGYLLFQTDLSSQFERIYDTNDPDIPRVKHLIRPLLTYSLIPSINETSSHPFIQQVKHAQEEGFSGYNFDNNDIVPLDTSRDYNQYFIPIGNSLSYGLKTQLIRRRGALDAKSAVEYQRVLDYSMGQTFNFRELRHVEGDRQPLSRFFATTIFTFDQFRSSTYYFYYPYANPNPPFSRHEVNTSVTYIFEKSFHQRIMSFERSFTLGYSYRRLTTSAAKNVTGLVTYSLSDYVMPSAAFDYHFSTNPTDPSRFQRARLGLTFQSPSQCWSVAFSAAHSIDKAGTDFGFDLALNLAGTGFGGVSDLGSQAQSK